MEPPKETSCNESPEARQAGPRLGKIFKWRVPALVAIALSIAYLAGYYIEPLPADNSCLGPVYGDQPSLLHGNLTRGASLPCHYSYLALAWLGVCLQPLLQDL
ncbi:hypothetical protein DYY67_1256 [Candidatus Nitrosotalea sp. TS]|nr:hypothetical protein [Candidatus Nitrosotalea sp. TS]